MTSTVDVKLSDAMLRSMAMGRCPYADGAHEFAKGICRLCLEDRDALIARAERERAFELPRPNRIQRRRTKGWRAPEGAIYVGRPTRWGNPFDGAGPFVAKAASVLGLGSPDEAAAALHAAWIRGARYVESLRPWGPRLEFTEGRIAGAAWLEGTGVLDLPKTPELGPLRGRDLMCWCSLRRPCHADNLIQVANR